jgi:predicted small lipoprotein YifL
MAYSVPALATFNLLMKRTGKPCIELILCCCAALSLAACGQTGPLYLPDKEGQAVPGDTPPVTEQAAEETIEENEDSR